MSSNSPYSIGETIQVWLCNSFYDSHFYDTTAKVCALREDGGACLEFANGYRIWPGCRMDRYVVTQSIPLARKLRAKRICVQNDACTGARADHAAQDASRVAFKASQFSRELAALAIF